MTIIIKNVEIIDSAEGSDITIDSAGYITDIHPHSPHANSQAEATVIDATGLKILPGFVDLHTHLREPGREDAETILSGSNAAAAGGYTAIFAMPNTDPVTDNPTVCEYVYRKGRDIGLVDVYPIGAVTRGQKGEQLADMGLMNASASRVNIFSDDGFPVHDALMMRRALEYVKGIDGIIAQHAQDPALTRNAQAHEGSFSAELGLIGWPRSGEEIIIARDIILAEETGSHVHFCHISTAGSVELVRRAKQRGIKVTAEVTPHHLLLDHSLLTEYDTVYKVNPPIREQTDIQALRGGLLDGTIDAIATDHAPHAAQDKVCDFTHAKPGMLGLETALGVVVTALAEHSPHSEVDWALLARIMSLGPASIARLPDHGRSIAVGEPANCTLVDAHKTWTVRINNLHSISRNTPYHGRELPVSVEATLLRGKFTFSQLAPARFAQGEELLSENTVISAVQRGGSYGNS